MISKKPAFSLRFGPGRDKLLAGTLARALLEHYLARKWLRSEPGARALSLTPHGQRELMPLLEAAAP